ncbi:MAG: hypothetical protein U9O96_00050, partial [Candidatus Thermoplasmatota archaeon]|nr:hypothetical protein [Candidatus Thermoplasmatota archaeon]
VWDNNDKEIIEADPHFENWEDEEADWTDGTLGYLYPNKDPEDLINKKLTDYSYSGHGGHPGSWYGRVEADSITDIFNNYSAWAYGKVKDVWQ